MSPNIFLAGPQKSSIFFPLPEGSGIRSGFIPLTTQTASITSLTPAGGLFIVLTKVISCAVRVSRAANAAFRAGIASARSASHSSLMALAALACSLAIASSAFTTYIK